MISYLASCMLAPVDRTGPLTSSPTPVQGTVGIPSRLMPTPANLELEVTRESAASIQLC